VSVVDVVIVDAGFKVNLLVWCGVTLCLKDERVWVGPSAYIYMYICISEPVV
jgi:hypothetical protein